MYVATIDAQCRRVHIFTELQWQMQFKWQTIQVLSCATSLGNKKENLNTYPSLVHISVSLGPSARVQRVRLTLQLVPWNVGVTFLLTHAKLLKQEVEAYEQFLTKKCGSDCVWNPRCSMEFSTFGNLEALSTLHVMHCNDKSHNWTATYQC